ncbi:hypothetical protein CRYUN_Cryun02cG0142100 [Craigia yunnanensis]
MFLVRLARNLIELGTSRVTFLIEWYWENENLYDPNQETLQALRGTNIELILGVPNGDLQSLATASTANDWVQNNIGAFSPAVEFRYIAVGNEIKPTDAATQYVLPAVNNIYNALVSAKLDGQIKDSTSADTTLLGNSYPPSAGSFSAKNAEGANMEIVVSETGWPSAGEAAATVDNASTYYRNLINYVNDGTPKKPGKPIETYLFTMFDENQKGPYETERHFGLFYPNKQLNYIDDTKNINIGFALFTTPGIVVQDGSSGCQNLFDATLDSFYFATEKVGLPIWRLLCQGLVGHQLVA